MKKETLPAFLTTFFIPLTLIVFSFAVMVPYMPPHYINRDSGIFLYMGRAITMGKLLYVDAWDHKGPMLFFINALGYWMGKRTGVWLIECIFLSISAIAGYVALKKILNPLFALLGTLSWLYSFFWIIVGGNFSEEFSLPMSFLSILFFYQYLKNEKRIYLYLIGIAMGFSFMLRPNNIGVQLVITAIIVCADIGRAKISRAIRHVFLISAGTVMVLAPIFIFFFIKGTFDEFINATFLFNIQYANNRYVSDFGVIPIFIIALGWPCWFAFLGWFFVLRDVLIKTQALPVAIAYLLLIGFPVEIYLATLSGRPYIHYVIMLLPYICFLSAFFLNQFIPIFGKQNNLIKSSVSIVIISAMLFSFWSAKEFNNSIDKTSPQLSEDSEIVTFIKANTLKSDYVLVWGQELSINFLTERESPTRFTYQTIFLIDGVVTPSVEHIFLSDLTEKEPAMIIITDALPFLDQNPESFEEQLKSVTPEAANVFRLFSEFVNKNYHKERTIQNFKVFSINE